MGVKSKSPRHLIMAKRIDTLFMNTNARCTKFWLRLTCLDDKRYPRKAYIIIIIIDPLTARVAGAPQMILQPVFSILPCSLLPSGLGDLQACPFPGVVFPSLPLSALSSSPFYYTLQDGFGQTWWKGDMTIPVQFCLFTMVRRSSCGPIVCWILARTSSLATWSLSEMRSILR